MRDEPVIGEYLTTYDDYFGVCRYWRVVGMRFYPEFGRRVPMVVLAYEESLSDIGAMELGG